MTSLALEVGRQLAGRGQFLALAESCTGGLIAKAITDIDGSSRWFERGLVTYSNLAKQELLGVPAPLLEAHGAVSRECAEAMALGLMVNTPADWGVAVTGIAGPGGGTADKPVGTVWIAWVHRDQPVDALVFRFEGDRTAVREATAKTALQGLIERMGSAAT